MSQHASPSVDQLMAMIRTLQDRLDQSEAGQAQAPAQVPLQVPIQIRTLKPERPTTYSGRKGESLDAWIFQVERYCHILQTPAAERVPFAGTFLKDHAAMWWRMVHTEIEGRPENQQWNQFTTQLKAQFQPINTAETARTRLDRLRQTTSVLLYNTAFRELMLELPHMHEEDRIHTYIKGLKPNVASLVAMSRPTTLLEAQQSADTADSIQFQHLPRRNFDNPRPHPDYKGPTPMDLDAISKLTDSERERLRKNGGCFRCRKTGHMARNCTMTNRTHPRIDAIDEEQPEESGKE